MFPVIRQKYKDVDGPQGYDYVSLKYDGIWCRLVCQGHKLYYFSREDQLKSEVTVPFEGDFEIIGEFMYGTQWAQTHNIAGRFYAFDCYRLGDHVLINKQPYSERYEVLQRILTFLPPESGISLVTLFDKSLFEQVWQKFVVEGDFEGVCFHKKQQLDNVFGRKKRVFTESFFITGYQEGRGKHLGTLGALLVSSFDGKVHTRIGGGFTDDQRHYIWTHREGLLGCVIEAKGNAVFDSGALRHPNFLRFRTDQGWYNVQPDLVVKEYLPVDQDLLILAFP